MPLVEIEDATLAEINQRLKVSENWKTAWEQILADPELKESGWELFKKKFPNVPIPELDAIKAGRKPIVDAVEAIQKKFDDYVAAQEKRESERAEREKETTVKSTIASARRRLKSEGWDDDGLEKIEALMQERQIGDYDVAAAYVRSQIPTPSPLISGYEGKDLNWFNPGENEPDHKLLMENPTRFKSDMIKKYFTDRASGNLAGWAA
jgi:hypothetical protein